MSHGEYEPVPEFESLSEAQRAPPEMMEKFLEFMGELTNVQEKLTSEEYKAIADSASAVYDSAIAYRRKKAEASVRDSERLSAMADRAIDLIVCKIVRDVPWNDLTMKKLVQYVATECGPGIRPEHLNKVKIKSILDREIKLLVRQGRGDPVGKGKAPVVQSREARKVAPY